MLGRIAHAWTYLEGEHITWFGKDREQALKEAWVFEKVMDYLEAFDKSVRIISGWEMVRN